MILGIVLVSGIPPDLARAQLLDPECDVLPGQSIQAAINAAQPGERIVVCQATYFEALVINKDGLILEGKPVATLDGTGATTTRYGITLANGLDGFTLKNFEVRNFKRLVPDPQDASSGIVSLGDTEDVLVENAFIHANAWTGILFAQGGSRDWVIRDTVFEANRFAGILTQGNQRVTIQGSSFTDALHGIIALDTKKLEAHHDSFAAPGDAEAGIVLAPSLGGNKKTVEASIHNNTFHGAWLHGIWAGLAKNSRIVDNSFEGMKAGITWGGKPEEAYFHDNAGAGIAETKNTRLRV